ncbi:MAG: acyl carrier protein [Firmicutes bacterium]|nr:acyl carrier protein [Bacillota bacterium]
MSKKETILEILKNINPSVNFEQVQGILENGYIDSMDFMRFIAELGQHFGVDIDADEITSENFDTVETIEKMIERLKG